MESPTGSFLRFAVIFVSFIGLSFGLTYIVQTISTQQTAAANQAAAYEALVGDKTK